MNNIINICVKYLRCFFLYLCVALTGFTFNACDDDGYPVGDFTAPLWATVRTISSSGFYLDCDEWGTCLPVGSKPDWYVPINGQRVIVVLGPLQDDYEGFDHAVHILSMQEVLTKNVEILTADNESDFGEDSVWVTTDGISLGKGYLNITYSKELPHTTQVDVVQIQQTDTTHTAQTSYDDGYLQLELRGNNQTTTQMSGSYSVASYYLGGLTMPSPLKGIKVKMNSYVTGEEEIVFDLSCE